MDIYLVILIMGYVAGSQGPLPYNMIECETLRNEVQAEAYANYPNIRKEDLPVYYGKVLAREDTTFECRQTNVRPELTFDPE